MKICYCLNSISHVGGIATIAITKANILTSFSNNEVYIIVTDHKNDTQIILNDNVHLIDLKINYYKNDWKSKAHVLYGLIVKRHKHFRLLKRILCQINPDIVISLGQSEKYFLPKIKGKWKTIREFHYDKRYRLRASKSCIGRQVAKLCDFYDNRVTLPKYDKVVILTQEDKEINWENNQKVEVIPNPLTITPSERTIGGEKKIIAVGRLVKQKNFSSLIKSFKKVSQLHPEWILEIYGDGELRDTLTEQIDTLNLKERVFLKGVRTDIMKAYESASILVMTSLYEGWGLVLTEAMACGLPVIAYSCPCGPKDIIRDGHDGFLIPPGDEDLLADRMCRLIADSQLRESMGRNARESSQRYTPQKIASEWMSLFNELTGKDSTAG